jgi:hypothetical protein
MQCELDELVWSQPPAMFVNAFRERIASIRRPFQLFLYARDCAQQYGASYAKLVLINLRATQVAFQI